VTIAAALILAASMDAIFRDYNQGAGTASVLVMRGEDVVFRKSYGAGATPESNYRLASMSKQFTAMAVLTLAHEHKLSLDDRITRFFPEFPELGITVRQMLTHTSGLVDYEDVIPAGTTIPLKDFDVLWLLQQQNRTLFPPGSKWQYSNSGYALLALIVEKVSGQTYPHFLHATLFEPAGMKHTLAYEKGISTVEKRMYGQPADQSLTSAVLGDGGIYSSVDDLAHWYAWLDHNPLYAEATVPRVRADQTGAAGPPPSYGYGWFIGTQRGERAIWHTGESIGFRNAVLRLPDEHLTVIVLTNRNEGHPIELALDAAAAIRH
jgi:CubicO group peptidase (beta-lactamase class C family)